MSKTYRGVAAAAIVGLALTGAGVAPTAVAQNDPGANAPTITQETGSLTIHKRANPTNVNDPTGNVDPSVGGEALEGVGFTIYKINDVDLKTNEGLANAANLKASDFMNGSDVDTSKVTAVGGQQTTDGNGVISYGNLDIGAYLVVETAPKDGYEPAAPFIAFVPMTQGNAETGGTSWNYDVHAYPKNYAKPENDKTVEDSGDNLGDEIVYTITHTARTIAPGQNRTVLRIEDTLDPRLTPPDPSLVTVEGFAAGTDYNVTVDGQKVTITFTAAGLSNVTNGQQIVAKIPATFTGEVGDGVVPNKAYVFDNNPNSAEDEEEGTTPEVESKFSGIQFKKVDGERAALEGAKFQVYGATDDATQCEDVVTNQDNLQAVGGEDTFTSGADGIVTINGLHVNDFTDNEGKANEFVKYCLVETESPAGFELLSKPIEFTLTAAQAGQLQSITVGDEEGEVVNLEDTTPNLPMTGGAGIGILAAIGAALVGVGAWFARRNGAKS